MIEKTTSNVVLSTEALAREEATLLSHQYTDFRIYQNMIVPAELRVCDVDVERIDIATGEIDDAAATTKVQFLSISTNFPKMVSTIFNLRRYS